jgi:hypothetical protein
MLSIRSERCSRQGICVPSSEVTFNAGSYCEIDFAMVILKALQMKARIFILGALLLALAVSPSAMRASSRALVVPSCHAPKSHVRVGHGRNAQGAPRKIAATLPGHHGPAPRMHRIRGKKISNQGIFVAASGRTAPRGYAFSPVLVSMQYPDGPNPSRGPPSTPVSL